MSEVFDYGSAKTLVMFCNGMWCGQSPASIKTLLKYYRTISVVLRMILRNVTSLVRVLKLMRWA